MNNVGILGFWHCKYTKLPKYTLGCKSKKGDKNMNTLFYKNNIIRTPGSFLLKI